MSITYEANPAPGAISFRFFFLFFEIIDHFLPEVDYVLQRFVKRFISSKRRSFHIFMERFAEIPVAS